MSERKHTPGPWRHEPDNRTGAVWAGEEFLASVFPTPDGIWDGLTEWPREPEMKANARLIAAAPDHAAIAAALCSGTARWEGSEFCIGGIRHSTKLDEFGVPIMTAGMRAAIAKATGAA